VAEKGVTEDSEGAWGIAEGAGDFLRRPGLDKASAQSFILALLGMERFEKEAVGFC